MPADVPPRAAFLRPLIAYVARIPASVHTKLRAGFLANAFLLVLTAILCGVVLARMSEQIDQLDTQEQKVDDARQMLYLITAQSHYRAMALLTHDESNNQSIADAKAQFVSLLASVEAVSPPEQRGLFARVEESNDRFAASGARVLALYRAGRDDEAMQLHLSEEHPMSHELEAEMNTLTAVSEQQAAAASDALQTERRLLTAAVAGFALFSLAASLLLGFLLSWSFTTPLRRIDATLALIAAGEVGRKVDIRNRDEFGTLGHNLNTTSQKLAALYGQLRALNERLRGTNVQLLEQLEEQVVELRRSRQLITAGEERVRRDIAELLHSRVQNRLLLVWYRLDDVTDLVADDPTEATRLLGEVRQQVDEIREQEVRELSHRLHPSIIRAGLVPAIDRLVEEYEPGLTIELRVDPTIVELDQPSRLAIPETVRLSAYRVVEEALGNVARHAHASHVVISLSAAAADRELSLEVVDDGEGFDPHQLREGLGLGSIAAHVGQVSGSWHIESAPGTGTRLRVRLPLDESVAPDPIPSGAA
jgi:signal transduction histidine kinase